MERDFLAELAASQQAPKKRKRGGLAGIWDRNKNVLRPVVSGALGLVNPALGAAAGAAMRGLDRPGKGGIGLDVGQAVRGGLEGYAAGRVGEMASGGASRLLGRGAGEGVRQAAGMVGADMTPTALPGQSINTATGAITGAPAAGSAGTGGTGRGLSRALGGASGRLGRGLGASASRVLEFIRENPDATGLSLQALSGIMGSQAQRRIREQEMAEERRRAQNLAMLALPLYNPTMGRR